MSSLRERAQDARIIITCGPGGIGKTTSAAAIGLSLATTTAQRVLVLTVDPARRLATALNLEGIGNEISSVDLPDALGTLSVAMLDTKASWDALIRRHADSEANAEAILSNTLYRNITERFIQSHDYIAMERLYELVETGEFDVIVVDTPPTRNALDFLDAPSRMADFFSSRLLRWLIAPARGGVAALAAKPFTMVADRILGGAFIGDMSEFFMLLATMYEGFVERARAVEALLTLPTTCFVVVSTLEATPLTEAQFFCEELTKRHLQLVGWLVNRVLPLSLAASSFELDERALEESPALQNIGDAATRERISSILEVNLEAWSTVARRERRALDQLATGGVPITTVASRDGLVNDVADLVILGQLIMDTPSVLKSNDVSATPS